MLDLEKVAELVLANLKQNKSEIEKNCSLSSPRAVGDAVQEYLGCCGLPYVLDAFNINVNSEFGRRAMEDMAFKDVEDNYYAVDVKTHNEDTDFNMPNLISVRRLATFYKNDDKNNFCILIVSYKVVNNEILFQECSFKRIESFSWKCLTLGALGWGQIQIVNANNLYFHENNATNRKEWMLELCKQLFRFYDEEILKIGERITWFESIESYWKAK